MQWVGRITRHLKYIISKYECQSEVIKLELKNVPYHIANEHENCRHKSDDREDIHGIYTENLQEDQVKNFKFPNSWLSKITYNPSVYLVSILFVNFQEVEIIVQNALDNNDLSGNTEDPASKHPVFSYSFLIIK